MNGQEREALIKRITDYRVFSLPCSELEQELGRGNHDFVAVSDLRAALAAREKPTGCTPCADCGDDYFVISGAWRTEDELWQRVVGTDPTVVLCPSCFARRAARKLAAREDTDCGETLEPGDYWPPCDPRCDAVLDGKRCTRSRGHVGRHLNYRATWP